ncbi:hypothetical protein QQ020_09530 [Fulvivirgaceae bacterium BMA12]|uniref:Uncharacterized protein n=1 Tax=Agaribacillus aureus TaxID=3051825 RepID=A0ABT8L3F5_9BACT|nr:hypothetical protein [Fulvivirgaceae bacterium BMA12]
MKDSKDKNIQEELDKNPGRIGVKPSSGLSEDEKAYQLIYRELRKAPDYALPDGFADKVAEKVRPKHRASLLTRDYKLLFLAIAGLLLLSFSMFWLLNLNISLRALSISTNMTATIIIGIIGIVIIQIADQKLLRSKIFRSLK